jgi:hypothetical protein
MRIFAFVIPLTLAVGFAVCLPSVWAGDKAPKATADVLAVAEAELARLSKQAETEKGPVYPPPSSEVAYLLLAGLAGRGTEVKRPTADDLRALGFDPVSVAKVQIFVIAKEARIAISSQAIQDRSGYWTRKEATLYRRQGDKWIARGSGLTAIDGVEPRPEVDALDPEAAREALIRFVKAKAKEAPPATEEDLRKAKINTEKDGTFTLQGIRIDPKAKAYSLVIVTGHASGQGGAILHWTGSFRHEKMGRWAVVDAKFDYTCALAPPQPPGK